MAYSTATHRPQLITGLRDLADYLETHPELPAPDSADVTVIVPRTTDQAMRAEVERVARLLDSPIDPEDVSYGHHRTGLDFGPVRYRLVAVLAGARARYDALHSYYGAVVPDAPVEI